jgi:hypothetical protein
MSFYAASCTQVSDGADIVLPAPPAGSTTVEHTLDSLAPGTALSLQSRCVVEDDGCLADMWSAVTEARTQRGPGTPLAPVVVSAHPTSLVLQLDNPGAVSDPRGVHLVLECNGVERVVDMGLEEAGGDTRGVSW